MTDEDRTLHESPLFRIPDIHHCPDILHCWALGPVCAFVATSIWWLITTPAFKVTVDGLSPEDENRLSLLKIRGKLWEFYKIKRTDPHFKAKGAEVWNLTLKMLGKKKKGNSPMLNVKAAEARGMLDFVCTLLEESLPMLVGTECHDACQMMSACGLAARDVDHCLMGHWARNHA
jgi:hypothetical protein